jgi:TolB-like protein
METITLIIDWLKEYGDVLGGIGSIFAIITLSLTNGRVILNRISGVSPDETGNTNAITVTAPSGQKKILSKIVKPNIKTIAVAPIEKIGDVNDDFISGLIEEIQVEIQQMGLVVTTQINARHILNITLRVNEDIVRATAHVHDMNKTSIFSERYTAKIADMITSQTEIATIISKDVTKHILAKKGEKQEQKIQLISPKNRALTTLLTILFGIIGIHRYYIGRPLTGILYTFTGGFFAVGWFMDIILASTGLLADGRGRPISGKKKRQRMEASLQLLPTNVDRE